MEMSVACSRFHGDSRQFTNSPTHEFTNSLESVLDERHEVDELRVRTGAGLGALQHDRAERARRHDGVRARVTQLLEPYVADPAPRLFFLVGEEKPAARSAAVRIVSISHGFFDFAAEPGDQRT